MQTQPNKAATKTEQRFVSNQSDAFSPRTNVALNNAVTDLSSILAKVLATRQSSTSKLPPEVRKFIDELMQSAFSLKNSLLKGLGASLQNRRYALAQLTSFGHLLTDLGKLAANENFSQLPPGLKNLFAAYRAYTQKNGQAFNGIDLLNFAFASLNDEMPEKLPPGIEKFLPAKNNASANSDNKLSAASSDKEQLAQCLKDIAEKFLPNFKQPPAEKMRPDLPEPKGPVQENAALQQQAKTAQSSALETPAPPKDKPAATQEKIGEREVASSPAPQEKKLEENPAKSMLPDEKATGQTDKELMPDNDLPSLSHPSDEGMDAPKMPATAANDTKIKGQEQNAPADTAQGEVPVASSDEKAMQALRNLANTLKDAPTTTLQQRQLLSDFINSNGALKGSDLKQLNIILSSIRQNMPGMLYQAASQRQLDFLPKLWSFMQLCDLSSLDTKQAALLQKSGESVEAFAKMASRTYFSDAATANNAAQRSLDFMLPLYINPQTSYPAYVNIYHEDRHIKNGEKERAIKDTWLRVCCLTEHIGAVETVLHLYDEHNLSVRLMFSDEDTAVSFEEFLPQLRAYLFKEKFNLTDLRIAALD